LLGACFVMCVRSRRSSKASNLNTEGWCLVTLMKKTLSSSET
jgi:hypothetical protein